jgi:hypothetical protein
VNVRGDMHTRYTILTRLHACSCRVAFSLVQSCVNCPSKTIFEYASRHDTRMNEERSKVSTHVTNVVEAAESNCVSILRILMPGISRSSNKREMPSVPCAPVRTCGSDLRETRAGKHCVCIREHGNCKRTGRRRKTPVCMRYNK